MRNSLPHFEGYQNVMCFEVGHLKKVKLFTLFLWSGSRLKTKMGETHVYLWSVHVNVLQKPSQNYNHPTVKINKLVKN